MGAFAYGAKSPKAIVLLASLITITAATTTILLVIFNGNMFIDEIMIDTGIDYSEITDLLLNPGRGMSQEIGKIGDLDYEYHQQIKLFEFSLSLRTFSINGDKDKGEVRIDSVISQEWLTSFRKLFDRAREKGVQAFCVFSYGGSGSKTEPDSCVVPGCNKGPECRGGMHTVLYHIEQLSSVMNDYPDVLNHIYTSMLGYWGEQHSTVFAKDPNCMVAVIDKWFECTRKSLPHITINVRAITSYVDYYNSHYGSEYAKLSFHNIPLFEKGTDGYRLGLWNDAFHCDYYDLGTFWDRQNDIDWFSKQTEHTHYGGETAGGAGGKGYNQWNDMPYFEYEARFMKPSWIRRFCDDIQEMGLWSDKEYYGSDPVYNGQNTIQQYVERHVGYRFVIRKSNIQSIVSSKGTLRVNGTIENVGFARIHIPYTAKLLIVDSNNNTVYSQDVNIDLNSPNYDIKIKYSGLKDGSYGVYLKLNKYSGKGHEDYDEKNPIMFANRGMYNATLKANKLGNFVVGQSSNETVRPTPLPTIKPALSVTIPFEQSYLILRPGDIVNYKVNIVGDEGKPYTVQWAVKPGGDVTLKDTTISQNGQLIVGKGAVGNNALHSMTYSITATALGRTATAFVKVHAHKFTLSDASTNTTLDKTHYTFRNNDPLTVSVKNYGTTATVDYNYVRITGQNPKSFTASVSELGQLIPNQPKTFTIRPNSGLSRGTHSAVVSVFGTYTGWDRVRSPTTSFTISFNN